MTIQVETDKPTPPIKTGRPHKYPFNTMQVGESFSLPLASEKHRKGMDRTVCVLRAAACSYGRKYNMKFTVRTVRDEGVARCWRVE